MLDRHDARLVSHPTRLLPSLIAALRLAPCFFNDTATTEIYTLSLHDALPISWRNSPASASCRCSRHVRRCSRRSRQRWSRSEEHTSELQSHLNLVCRLLLEKKKKKKTIDPYCLSKEKF